MKEGLFLIFLVIGVGGFITYEGIAFATILDNPIQLDTWHSAGMADNSYYSGLGDSDLYRVPGELGGNHLFMIQLKHLGHTTIEITFEFIHCVPLVYMIGSGGLIAESVGFSFNLTHFMSIIVENNTAQLNLRNMNYPNDFDILFIRVDDMGTSGVELRYKVGLIE